MKNAALVFTALVLSALAAPSFAAVDVAPVVTEIDTYPALIGSVGGAVLIVALAVAGIKWVRSTFAR